jgi:hypothetical protein
MFLTNLRPNAVVLQIVSETNIIYMKKLVKLLSSENYSVLIGSAVQFHLFSAKVIQCQKKVMYSFSCNWRTYSTLVRFQSRLLKTYTIIYIQISLIVKPGSV